MYGLPGPRERLSDLQSEDLSRTSVDFEAQAKVRAGLKDNPLVTIYEYDADHAFARGSGSARVPALAQQADERTQAFFSDKLA